MIAAVVRSMNAVMSQRRFRAVGAVRGAGCCAGCRASTPAAVAAPAARRTSTCCAGVAWGRAHRGPAPCRRALHARLPENRVRKRGPGPPGASRTSETRTEDPSWMQTEPHSEGSTTAAICRSCSATCSIVHDRGVLLLLFYIGIAYTSTGPRRLGFGRYYASPLDVQEHAYLLGAVRGPRSWAPVRDGPACTACLLPGDVAAALSQGTCVVTVLVFPEARTVVFRT